jgi:phosphoribosyl 1,2-cyclic phosphate phosphodiesterase
MKTIDPSQERLLQGVTHMVVNGLRHETHPTHQTIDEAIAFADRLKVEEAYVVHMSHHVQPHEKESALMPTHRHLAYDGLKFNCMI